MMTTVFELTIGQTGRTGLGILFWPSFLMSGSGFLYRDIGRPQREVWAARSAH